MTFFISFLFMIPWTEKWMLKLVAVWVCADVVALTVSPRRGGWWVMVTMLVIGMVCKIALSGLFVLVYLDERRSCSFKNLVGTPSVSSPSLVPRLTMKAMTAAAERIRGNLQPGDSTHMLMNLVRESGLLLVDGLMVSPHLTSDNLLGEGAFGRVYDLDLADVKRPLCIKVKKDTQSNYCFLWEIDNLQRLAGLEGVPRVTAVSVVPEGFIMTRHGRRNLETWLMIWEKAKPREKEVADVLRKLCIILINLHALKVCHNDLKGDNVMVEFDKTKKKKRWAGCKVTLVDFAILCNYGFYPFGSIPRAMFMPHNDPALMRAERTCSEATDVFSMGYLLQRTLPFFASQRERIKECSQRAMGPCHLRPSFVEIEKVLNCALK